MHDVIPPDELPRVDPKLRAAARMAVVALRDARAAVPFDAQRGEALVRRLVLAEQFLIEALGMNADGSEVSNG